MICQDKPINTTDINVITQKIILTGVMAALLFGPRGVKRCGGIFGQFFQLGVGRPWWLGTGEVPRGCCWRLVPVTGSAAADGCRRRE